MFSIPVELRVVQQDNRTHNALKLEDLSNFLGPPDIEQTVIVDKDQ